MLPIPVLLVVGYLLVRWISYLLASRMVARQFEADVLKDPAPLVIFDEFGENVLVFEVFSGSMNRMTATCA